MKVRSPITQALEDFFDAAWRRTPVLNRKIVDIAYLNLNFGFELARAKTFSDVLKLQADYWQKLFNTFQGEEFRNWLVEAGEPRSTLMQNESAKEEHPQAKQTNASGPVMGTAIKKPEQKSAKSPKQRAATRAPEGKKKAEKRRSKRKDHRMPSSEAHTGARKRRASQDGVSQGRPAEIQFGRLDDNAVRFTRLEAWRLVNGTWRSISVDEVLSDAIVVSKARFDQLFPQVPQLPTDAFLPDHDQE